MRNVIHSAYLIYSRFNERDREGKNLLRTLDVRKVAYQIGNTRKTIQKRCYDTNYQQRGKETKIIINLRILFYSTSSKHRSL